MSDFKIYIYGWGLKSLGHHTPDTLLHGELKYKKAGENVGKKTRTTNIVIKMSYLNMDFVNFCSEYHSFVYIDVLR